MVLKNVVYTESISLKNRKWSLYANQKKAKNGMINYGKTLLICSVLLISRFVHWNAVQVTLPTLK